MPYASAQGVRVYYELHGTGPAIVLAHGLGGNHAIWYEQIAHLQNAYTVVVLDFPGFGLSDSDSEEYEASTMFADAIVSVLDDARIDRAILVGQSLGTVPVLAVAIAHPERVAAAILASSLKAVADGEIQTLLHADRASADQLPLLDRLFTPEMRVKDPARLLLFKQMDSFNSATGKTVKAKAVASTDEIRSAISAGVSVCFIRGGNDPLAGTAAYARLAELLPEALIETAPGGAHALFWEEPKVFNETLERVLERLPVLEVAAGQTQK